MTIEERLAEVEAENAAVLREQVTVLADAR